MSEKNHEGRVAHNSVPLVLSLMTLPVTIGIWFNAVSSQVREPYLDEVFHVGQVQQYCRGNYWHWDPKITTPPGLYILSVLFYKITGRCDLDALRFVNALSLFAIFFFLLHTAPPVSPRSAKQLPSQKSTPLLPLATLCPQQIHSALNVCLFPPLFFFCALYYTDVASTLSVLFFTRHLLENNSRGPSSFFQACISIALAIISLSFRQTNIFWVGIFPIVLLALGALHQDVQSERPPDGKSVVLQAWGDATLYDPQMRDSILDDFWLTCISTVTLALRALYFPRTLLKVVRLVWPYLLVVGLFVSFVLWNGGVVLGDKSNHVATIHLPQMLYIWAYTSFFSFGLTYPFVAQGLLSVFASLPIAAILEPLLIFSRRKFLPRYAVVIGFVAVIAVTVKFNTIVHPFTLADNRHFTFYVFRYLLLHPAIKYLAIPIYMSCAWSVLQTLGAPAQLFEIKEDEKDDGQLLRLNDAPFGEGCTISFVMVWIGVSALQLITAPLVEPRYFILPWIMWRLRVPQAHPGASLMARPTHKNWKQWWNKERQRRNIDRQSWANWFYVVLWAEHDHRLYLETLWFIIINTGVGYIFLNWGFEWPSEPGKTQRFMW
ncbi:glycosyltransferase family 59 protein, partial [Aureobasidium melanogenum]